MSAGRDDRGSSLIQGGFQLGVWLDERGAIAVIAVIMLTALVGMAALVVDLGCLFTVRGELQNGADSGALAGVVELATNGSSEVEAMAVA